MASAASGKEKFFLSIAPHFEVYLLQEMREVFPLLLNKAALPMNLEFPEYEIKTGGVEFQTDLFIAVQFQFFLKTAHRLLWRVDEFKARDFPTLFNRTKSSRLRTLLGNEKSCGLKVSASESRLGQEKRIGQTLLEGLGKIEAEDSKYKIFVRVHQDQVQLSLDLSGEHLHFRNYAIEKGEAPLRETWAALFMRMMCEDQSLSQLQKICLVDPFAGSGTLLFESALMYTPNFDRRFAINEMAQGPKLFKQDLFQKNYRHRFAKPFSRLVAFELDPSTRGKLESNGTQVRAKFSDFPELEIRGEDSLKSQWKQNSPVWIFTNPPYGDRLQSSINLRSPKELQNFVQKLQSQFRPQRMGLVVPQEGLRSARLPIQKSVEFSNGGIACAFVVLNFEKEGTAQ